MAELTAEKKKKAVKKEDTSNIDKFRSNIEKMFGKESGIFIDDPENIVIEKFSTGSLYFDVYLKGGYPKGKMVELYGHPGTGKTTSAMSATAQHQKKYPNEYILWIDLEDVFDPDYFKALGVDINKNFILLRPQTGEESYEAMLSFTKEVGGGLIVVDSVPTLLPEKIDEQDMGDPSMALPARLNSQGIRKLLPHTKKHNTTIMFLNQLRCLDENTLINLNGVLTEIKKVKVGDFINGVGVKNIVASKVDGISIFSKYRPEFNISLNHKQPIINQEGSYLEVLGDKIREKDWLIQPIQSDVLISKTQNYLQLNEINSEILNALTNKHKSVTLPNILNEDVAFVLGAYYSDGAIMDYPEKKHFGIQWDENNLERREILINYLTKVFGKDGFKHKNAHITLFGEAYLKFFKALGMKRYGRNKDVPKSILESPLSVIKSFIRGVFFDTHGFDDNGFIFTNENDDSIKVISTLLYYIGIFSDIRPPRNNAPHLSLYLTGNDAIKFRNDIGFEEKSKSDKALHFKEPINGRGKYDVVPGNYAKSLVGLAKTKFGGNLTDFPKYGNLNMCFHKNLNVCRKTLIDFLEYVGDKDNIDFIKNNRFTEILSIEKNDDFHAIDIEVDADNGLFVASQFLTHNSNIGNTYIPESTTGGNTIPYYCRTRLGFSRSMLQEATGRRETHMGMNVKLEKANFGKEKAKFSTEIEYGVGFDVFGELVDLAEEAGIIQKSGTWYAYGESKIGQGKNQVITFFKDNEEFRLEIEGKVRSHFNI